MIDKKQIDKIRKEIEKSPSSIIKIEDVYNIISKITKIKEVELKTIEYDTFFEIVKILEKENVLKSYGKKMNSMMMKSLSLKFKVLNVQKEIKSMNDNDKLFLYSLNPNINTSFYFKNIKELERDRANLQILSDFLNNVNQDTPFISINERSYELFGYEKCLSGAGVTASLISRTKVALDDIKCFETYTPLQCHIMSGFYKDKVRNILIVENLDTYWSFHRTMNESAIGEKIDMLVYGCGNKASGNFKFHRHYSINENDNILYFGDIDPEGFSIYKRVKEANPTLNIKLSKELYSLAIDVALKKGLYDINNENQSKLSELELEDLLSCLDKQMTLKIKNILTDNKYIPQEAVNYRILIEEIKKKGAEANNE